MDTYASFEPLPEDVERKKRQYEIFAEKCRKYVNQVVEKYNLTELKSDILNTTSYYLEKSTGYIWEQSWPGTVSSEVRFRKSNFDDYKYIRELNGISRDLYNQQPQMLTSSIIY